MYQPMYLLSTLSHKKNLSAFILREAVLFSKDDKERRIESLVESSIKESLCRGAEIDITTFALRITRKRYSVFLSARTESRLIFARFFSGVANDNTGRPEDADRNTCARYDRVSRRVNGPSRGIRHGRRWLQRRPAGGPLHARG